MLIEWAEIINIKESKIYLLIERAGAGIDVALEGAVEQVHGLLVEGDVPDAAHEHPVHRLASPLLQARLGAQEERVSAVDGRRFDGACTGFRNSVNSQNDQILNFRH